METIKSENHVLNLSSELLQLVSFILGQEEFGVDILRVHEINKMVKITHIPNSPSCVMGIINLRGKVIPIVDLRKRFGFPSVTYDKNTRIIVVEISEMVIGFIVDAVKEVLRVHKDITEAPPSLVSGVDKQYILGIGKLKDRLLILLDLEKIFSSGEMATLSEGA